MIEFENVSFSYDSTERESGVHDISLKIPTGQLVLLCGESGCGKTTLTRIINKLIPEYYEGKLTGKIKIDGSDVTSQAIYDFNGKIGTVFQNPRSQFFNVDTTSEIAFGCENYGIASNEILSRMGQAIGELKIEDLMGRNLFSLSGGEKQKVACASVSSMLPEILILDEPSSNLDVSTIADLKRAILRWKALGRTVIVAEHRIYYLMDLADRVIYMQDGYIKEDLPIDTFRQFSENELHSMGLRSLHPVELKTTFANDFTGPELILENFSFSYGKIKTIDIPKIILPKGAIVGILGHNGAGKSTFAKCLCGLEKSAQGILELDGQSYTTKQRLHISYMVMQDVNHQLFTESVLDEIMLSMPEEDSDKAQSTSEEILKQMNLQDYAELHPMSLSGGQKQRVAIGSAIAADKSIIILDEPTSGLDYRHMLEVSATLKQLSSLGKTVFVITHDPELLVQCCNYFLFIEKGQLSWNGGWSEEIKQHISDFFEPAAS